MKVLTVIPEMGAGGAEVVAAAVAEDAAAHGHRSLLASAPGFRADGLRDVRHLPLPLGSRRPADLARSVARLRTLTRAERPDVVHAHNPKAALVARLAVGRSTPVVTTLHGVAGAEVAGATALLRRTTDRLVVVSDHLAAQVAVYGFDPARVEVVENAVPSAPVPDRPGARAELGRELGTDPAAFTVLCAARMVEQKRHDLLLEAWARTAMHGVLLLAGDGPTRGRIEAQVRDLGLGERVRLLGTRADVPRLMTASDLLVLPTDWEGLPISVLEAMAIALPVVVSRVGGVLDTLDDAVRLVEPGSAASLATAITRLANDPHERAALGRRGHHTARTRFGTGPMLARYRAVHLAAAATPGRRSGARLEEETS